MASLPSDLHALIDRPAYLFASWFAEVLDSASTSLKRDDRNVFHAARMAEGRQALGDVENALEGAIDDIASLISTAYRTRMPSERLDMLDRACHAYDTIRFAANSLYRKL